MHVAIGKVLAGGEADMVAVAAGGGKQAAGGDGDPALPRVVAGAVSVAAFRQFDPHQEAAGRLGSACSGGDPRALRVFNYAMALLLAATAVWIVVEEVLQNGLA